MIIFDNVVFILYIFISVVVIPNDTELERGRGISKINVEIGLFILLFLIIL